MTNIGNLRRSERESGYVTVELPVRLSHDEFAQLSAAAALGLNENKAASPFKEPEPRVVRALERASAVIALRKRREQEFGAEFFGEPAWDILLDLFIGRAEGRKTNSTSASIASRAPTTTALRYLNILEKKGLIIKQTAEHDMRVHYVQLSDSAYRSMVDLLAV